MNLFKLKKTAVLLRQNLLNVILFLFFSILAIKLYSLYARVQTDDGQWEQFKATHHCKMLVNKKGNQRLSWQCDDGETHYRWRQQR